MAKKKPAKKNETTPGVEYYTEGKGFTEQTRYRITNLSIPEGYAAYQKLAFRPGENEFEMSIFSVEKTAKRILEGAGFPSDPSFRYNIPGGEKFTPSGGIGGWGNLTALVEARGYRKREHLEWFAAEILINIQSARDHIAEGKAAEAAADGARAGQLVGFAIAKGYFSQTGEDGGSKEKKILPVQDWVNKTIKQYPEKKEPFFWNSIPDDDEGDDPQKIDGATMIREGDTLVVTYEDGRRRTLAHKSFKRYIAHAKEFLKR